MSRRSSPAGLGVSTVLTVLLVLCLATFAALTLASAGADLRLSRAAAARTQEYYDADAAAAKLYAGFCAGSDPALAADLPVGDTRTLHVELEVFGAIALILGVSSLRSASSSSWEAVRIFISLLLLFS